MLGALLLGFTAAASSAQAQAVRTDGAFYGKFGVGYAEYTGDLPLGTRRSVFDLRGLTGGRGSPFLFASELGYQFSPQLAIALGFQGGTYPFVGVQQAGGTGSTWRFTPQLFGRYTFADSDRIVAPYVDGGINVTLGGDRPPTSMGIGPSVGIGLDILHSRALSFYVESRFNLTFPDDAIDGTNSSGASFDMVNQLLGLGLKVRFTTPPSPQVISLDGPADIQTGESVTFTATVNEEEAVRPLSYQWQFGDGGTESGRTVTHTYVQPGTYTVTFTAKNEVGEASRSLSVTVEPSPQPVSIASLRAKPNPVEEGQSVRFSSTIEGGRPLSYNWRFGDGTTASGQNPTHTYTQPGTYTVTFTAKNEVGEASRSLSVTVEPSPQPVSIASLRAKPNPVEEGQSVHFSSTIEGGRPLSYNWRFGDGTTASGQNPTHTYEKPGQYTVRLNVGNDAGKDSDTTVVRVKRVLPEVCTSITEMNAAFFENGSSTVTDKARSRLQENVDVLSKCPNLRVQIKAFAAPDEQTPKALSQKRAQAVANFYTDHGIERSRVTVRGQGQVERASTKKGTARQHRRADTVPLQGEASGKAAPTSEKDSFASSGAASRGRSKAGRWAIVVASMSREDGANAIAQRYRDRFGFDSLSVEIVTAELKKGLRHRVAVGRFANVEAAKHALDEYEANLPPGAWLLRLHLSNPVPQPGNSPEDPNSVNEGASSSLISDEQSRTSASGAVSQDKSKAGRWTIVVASMSREDGANAIAQRYRDRFGSDSLSVEIVTAELKKGFRHRVAVGRFANVEAAKHALDEYEANLPPGAWLLRLR